MFVTEEITRIADAVETYGNEASGIANGLRYDLHALRSTVFGLTLMVGGLALVIVLVASERKATDG